MFMGLNAHFLLLLCVKLTINVIIIESLLKVKEKNFFFHFVKKLFAKSFFKLKMGACKIVFVIKSIS